MSDEDPDPNLDDMLDRVFPQGDDNTVEWLCYCLSPYQMAIVHQMMELNASDMDEDKQGSYKQRQQRLWQVMTKADDENVNVNNIEQAGKFVREHQIW